VGGTGGHQRDGDPESRGIDIPVVGEVLIHSLREDGDMAKKKVADSLVDVLAEAGVRQICGVSGDSLNGTTDSIRARKQVQRIHVRHEETAASAAGAEAYLTPGFFAIGASGACRKVEIDVAHAQSVMKFL